jgi:hypothetical protein
MFCSRQLYVTLYSNNIVYKVVEYNTKNNNLDLVTSSHKQSESYNTLYITIEIKIKKTKDKRKTLLNCHLILKKILKC